MRDIAASYRADLEIEHQAYEQARGFAQESEDDTLCADDDQHVDLFPPKYYNYLPVGVTVDSEPRPFDAVAVEALFADNNSKTSLEQLPKLNYVYEQVWDLDAADNIGFGLRLDGPRDKVRKHEQLTISYGARSNSFLLVRYGFAIIHNPYDFVRRPNITIETFIEEPIGDPAVKTLFDAKLAELNMKHTL